MSYQTESLTEDPFPAAEPAPIGPSPDYNAKKSKKDLHFAFFVLLCIIAGIAGFAAFLNFCLSLSQVSSSTVMANGTSIFTKKSSSCSDFKHFWPVRWEMELQRDVIMKCPWPVANSAFRCIFSLIAMGNIALFVFVLMKPDMRWLNWGFFGVTAFITVMYFVMAIADGTHNTKGNNFCKDGMPEAAVLFKPSLKVNNETFGIECFPGPYTGMIFSNIFVLLSFPALAAYFFFYHRHTHKHGESAIPNRSDDERQPIAAPKKKKKKMFMASTIKDESLTQDVTGDNPFDPKTGMVDPSGGSGVY